ncbi:MAG: D-2-hydroxyacid dehydrogenase [Thermomicrobiales bacterium]
MIALIVDSVGNEWKNLPADLDVRLCAGDVASLNAALEDDVEILVTDAMPTAVDRCGGLRWVQLVSSGANQAIDHPLQHRGVVIASAAGICAVHIAEFIVARILFHTKQFAPIASLQSERRWGDRLALARPELRGQHAILIGYGGVGRETARLLAAFGMWISAVARDPAQRSYDGYLPYAGTGDPDASLPERIVTPDALADVLPDADVVVVSVSLNPSTYHLIDAALLARCRPTAILINTARGQVVDADALTRALDAGQLAHAYLDVFDEEPLSPESPLWAHPKISVSPHMAGVMPDAALKLEALFLANLARYRRGERLINQLRPLRQLRQR